MYLQKLFAVLILITSISSHAAKAGRPFKCEVLLGHGLIGDILTELNERPAELEAEITVLAFSKGSELERTTIESMSQLGTRTGIQMSSGYSTTKGVLTARLVLRGKVSGLLSALAELQILFNAKPIEWVNTQSLPVATNGALSKPIHYSNTEFTTLRKHRHLFPPHSEQLSLQRPLALLTFYRKPAYAALSTDFLVQRSPDEVIAYIESIVGPKLSSTIKTELANQHSNLANASEIKGTKLTGPPGQALLDKLVREQRTVLVRDGLKSFILFPLTTIIVPATETPLAEMIPDPEEIPKTAPAPVANKIEKVLEVPLVEPTQTQRAPVTVKVKPSDLQESDYRLSLSADLKKANRELADGDFNEFMRDTLTWSVAADNLWQLIYTSPINGKSFLIHFNFYKNGGHQLETRILKVESLSLERESVLWQDFAKYHRIENQTVILDQGFWMNRVKRQSVFVPADVQMELQMKYRLSFLEIQKILLRARYSAPEPTGTFWSTVKINGELFEVIFAQGENNSVSLKAIFPK